MDCPHKAGSPPLLGVQGDRARVELSSSSPSLGPTDWAYLAGFVDGEGCIQAKHRSGRSKWWPTLQITQADHVSLRTLYDKFQLGTFWVSNYTSRSGKPRSNWQISSHSEVEFVLIQLLPYLNLKKKQAKVALRLLEDPTNESLATRLKELKRHRTL